MDYLLIMAHPVALISLNDPSEQLDQLCQNETDLQTTRELNTLLSKSTYALFPRQQYTADVFTI